MNPELLSWLVDRRDAMVQLLQKLVEIESPSTDKGAVDRLGEVLGAELRASGVEVRTIEVGSRGNHLLGEVEGSGGGQILALGHMDTVWDIGTLKVTPFRFEGVRAYGPGSFDMKAGLVQLVFALRGLRVLRRAPRARVVALITSDEEIGSQTSRPIIEEQARFSRAVLVLEPSLPPDGRLKTSRKGGGSFELRVRGKAAHAGLDPQNGVSAIEELACQIQALHRMTDLGRGITVNVGTASGGTRVNVVADEAHAEVDLRVSTLSDGREMEERIVGLEPFLEGAEVVVTGGLDRPPLERTDQVIALYRQAAALGAELGFDVGEGAAGGGSDGNITAGLGIPTLDGLGAVGDGAHARHEHVMVEEMPRRAALLARLFETL